MLDTGLARCGARVLHALARRRRLVLSGRWPVVSSRWPVPGSRRPARGG